MVKKKVRFSTHAALFSKGNTAEPCYGYLTLTVGNTTGAACRNGKSSRY